jgi:hypothetical protein
MSPRRRVEPPIEKISMERDIRELRARLDAMETSQRRTPDTGDASDAENEEVEVKEVVVEDVVEECLLKEVVKLGSRVKIDTPMYEGNLDIEELLDLIQEMEKYFDYEYFKEEKKVRNVITRLKGHATLWWDELQANRRSKGKKISRVGMK